MMGSHHVELMAIMSIDQEKMEAKLDACLQKWGGGGGERIEGHGFEDKFRKRRGCGDAASPQGKGHSKDYKCTGELIW